MHRNLFIDTAEDLIKNNHLPYTEKHLHNVSTHRFNLSEENQKLLKKPVGDYYTINYNLKVLYQNPKLIKNKIIKALKLLSKKYPITNPILIIGLGNSSVIGDSLGPKTINKLIATNHYDNFITIPKVALFTPEVIGKTGISSFKLIKMVVKDLKPSLIIFIDSLETISKQKLNTTIEITDTGIIPASSLNTNQEITQNTFNIPLIAIGSPLFYHHEKDLFTSLNINEIVEKTSDLIANSLNSYFFS